MSAAPNTEIRRSTRIQALAVKSSKGACGADAPTVPLPGESDAAGMDTLDDVADLAPEIVSTTASSQHWQKSVPVSYRNILVQGEPMELGSVSFYKLISFIF